MNLFSPKLDKFRREFARAVANHKYEVSPAGILFSSAHALMSGVVGTTLNGKDLQLTANTFTTEGLTYLMSVGFNGTSPANAFYVAPHSGSGTPSPALTAASFPGTMTEFTGYAEPNRPEYVESIATAGSVTNSASRAEITANTAGNVWGAGLLSVSTKGATTGILAACAKFGAVRALTATDILAFQWGLTLTPA